MAEIATEGQTQGQRREAFAALDEEHHPAQGGLTVERVQELVEALTEKADAIVCSNPRAMEEYKCCRPPTRPPHPPAPAPEQ